MCTLDGEKDIKVMVKCSLPESPEGKLTSADASTMWVWQEGSFIIKRLSSALFFCLYSKGLISSSIVLFP